MRGVDLGLGCLRLVAGHRRHWLRSLSVVRRCWLLMLGLLLSMPLAASTDVLVLQSHDSLPYQQTVNALQTGLNSSKQHPSMQVVLLSGSMGSVDTLLQSAQPRLIVTLGTPATQLALQKAGKTPVVACLVLDADEVAHHANATAVSLAYPLALQWQWLRRMLPDARQIAVLYDPKQGVSVLADIQKLAQADGVTVIAAPFANAESFPDNIKNLPTQLDALWPLEGAAYNTSAIRELLLYSFRNRVPLIGLSAQWVKAGALYALDWDYQDLGAQTADLVLDVLLKNASPGARAIQTPRKVWPVMNKTTAEHMKLPMADTLLQDMAEVFQ